MAITVAFDGTRISDAETLSVTEGEWVDTGGKAANLEPDFVYQNTRSVSEKVGTTALGVGIETSTGTPASYDLTTPSVLIYKVIATNPGVMLNKASQGGVIEVGSGDAGGNLDEYDVVGGDTYPIKGGWLIIPVDPNGGNYSTRPGTAPTLTALDWFGWRCDFSTGSKSENVAMDALDFVTNGTGLTLTGNTPDGDFQDFIDSDEGTAANRWGIVSTQSGILFVTGVLTIGTATETDFTDSGQVIVFPEAEFLNSVGFFGIDIGLQHASSVISITSCIFQGRGTVGGTVDTRPDYGCTGTSGAATYTSCTFATFREFVMTSGMTVDRCSFVDGLKVTQSTGVIDGCVFSGGTQGDGDGYLYAGDDITDCSFTFNDGHAIRWAGAATASMDITNCSFSGSYGIAGSTDATFYNPNTSGTLTLNLSGVTGTFTVRTASGGTTVVNNNITVTYNNLINGSEVRVYKKSDGSVIDGVESVTGNSFNWSVGSGVGMIVVIVGPVPTPPSPPAVAYLTIVQDDVSYVSTISVDINQQIDRNYKDPA